jgi:hypothetical protein
MSPEDGDTPDDEPTPAAQAADESGEETTD